MRLTILHCLSWAFFCTVLPHKTGPRWSWTPFYQKHCRNVSCFYKTQLSYMHKGHWWASSPWADSGIKGIEVATMSHDQSCPAGRSVQVTAHPLGLRQWEFHKWSGLHAQQSSQQTRLLHPVASLTFCIKILQFHGHACFSKCKKQS